MFNIEEKVLKYLKGKRVKDQPVATLTSTEVDEGVTNENNSKRQEFHNTIKEIGSKLNELNTSNGRVVLEKLEYTPKTEEEIKKQAQDEIDGEYALKRLGLDRDIQNRRLETQRKTEEAKSGVQGKKEEINSAYLTLEKQLENQALKRGISRSSIIAEQLKDLGVEKIKDYLKVDESVASEIKGLSNKLQDLEREYTFAVESLDIEKALGVKEKIEELTDKQNKELEKVIKHNNEVEKSQLALDEKYFGGVENATKAEKESQEAKLKQQIITTAMNYYGSLPKQQRLKEFEEDEVLKELLGEVYSNIERYVKYFP